MLEVSKVYFNCLLFVRTLKFLLAWKWSESNMCVEIWCVKVTLEGDRCLMCGTKVPIGIEFSYFKITEKGGDR